MKWIDLAVFSVDPDHPDALLLHEPERGVAAHARLLEVLLGFDLGVAPCLEEHDVQWLERVLDPIQRLSEIVDLDVNPNSPYRPRRVLRHPPQKRKL